MKAIEQYFHAVLFIMLYKVFTLCFKFVTIQMKHIEQYFHVVLFIPKRVLPNLGYVGMCGPKR